MEESMTMALLESQAARFGRIIRVLLICWAVSICIMCSVLVVVTSEEESTVTTEVAQEADNAGSNVYSGGDYYGSKAND